MRVLLINPKFPISYWGMQHAVKFDGKRAVFPPLGLLTVSALLPDYCETQLVDCEVEKLKDADIDSADLVFVTGMLVQKKAVHEIVDRCKARGKTVVVGGPYVSTSMEDVPQADHIFVGEVETTLPQFFQDLARGEDKKIYKAAERPALTSLPVPHFGLANLRRYSMMSVQFSRGCPFDCEFCDIIEIYGRVPRTKTNEQVLAELDALFKLGWRGSVFFVDDNLIGNKKKLRMLLPELIAWQEKHGRPFVFFTQASLNLADDKPLLEQMRRAGFNTVFLGIETPDQESLVETQKLQNTGRSLLESVQTIQSYGIEVMAGFIVGFDHDKPDIFKRQIDFIRQGAIPRAMVGVLTALPDTQLWRRLQKEGRLLTESSGNNFEDVNFIPKMDVGKLVAGHRTIVQTIYAPREYYERVLSCMKRLPTNKPISSKNHELVNSLTALVRITVKLGVMDRERREFWRFIKRVCMEHPGQLVHGLEHAAIGYHFRKLSFSE